MANPRHQFGLRAEAAVAAWLGGDGWRILARRWKVAEGELDLVAIDPDGTLVGVEVRGRRRDRSGSALESVDHRHLTRLRGALVRYALSEPVAHRGLRLDLVTLDGGESSWQIVRHPAIDAW